MKTEKTKKVSTERKKGRRDLQCAPPPAGPLMWWRTIRADHFNAPAAAAMRNAIANVAILGEPTWRDAARGDEAAAVRLALRLHPKRSSPVAYDLVMTAVAACAAEDSAAACLAMSQVLRGRPGASRADVRIATSWLVRSFMKTMCFEEKNGCAR